MFSQYFSITALVLVSGAAAATPAPTGAKQPTPKSERNPAPPALTSEANSTDATRAWVEVAGGPAFPFNRGPTWLRGQLRVGVPLMRLDERLDVSFVLPISIGSAQETGAFSSTSSVLALDLIPSARLGVRGPGSLGFRADFGVGVGHFRYGFEIPSLGKADSTRTGLAFRLSAGVDYRIGRSFQIFLEPLHLLFHTAQEGVFRFGNTSFTSSTGAGTQASVLAGAAYLW